MWTTLVSIPFILLTFRFIIEFFYVSYDKHVPNTVAHALTLILICGTALIQIIVGKLIPALEYPNSQYEFQAYHATAFITRIIIEFLPVWKDVVTPMWFVYYLLYVSTYSTYTSTILFILGAFDTIRSFEAILHMAIDSRAFEISHVVHKYIFYGEMVVMYLKTMEYVLYTGELHNSVIIASLLAPVLYSGSLKNSDTFRIFDRSYPKFDRRFEFTLIKIPKSVLTVIDEQTTKTKESFIVLHNELPLLLDDIHEDEINEEHPSQEPLNGGDNLKAE